MRNPYNVGVCADGRTTTALMGLSALGLSLRCSPEPAAAAAAAATARSPPVVLAFSLSGARYRASGVRAENSYSASLYPIMLPPGDILLGRG